MQSIDPAELSAFLDGELPAERAAEVRAALAHDVTLRQSYEQLLALDADCKTQAAAAMFRPRVSFEAGLAFSRYGIIAGVLGLLLIRVVLKAAPPLVGTGLVVLLLVLFCVWGLRRILHATDADGEPSVLAADY
jgi:anti-sigma factor RsiW